MRGRALAIWSAALLVVCLTTTNPITRALALLVALNGCILVRKPEMRLRPLLIGVGCAVVIAAVTTLLLSHTGTHALVHLPSSWPAVGGALTAEALSFGITTGIGVAAAVLAVAVCGLGLDGAELVDALPTGLQRTATTLGSALNLVPRVARTTRAIAEAQRMRGWRVGGLRSSAELLVPVVLTTVEDSLQLAEAMEARGFGTGRRSHFVIRQWERSDIATAVAGAAALLAALVAAVTGGTHDWYPFPNLVAPTVGVLPLVALVMLVAGMVQWRRI